VRIGVRRYREYCWGTTQFGCARRLTELPESPDEDDGIIEGEIDDDPLPEDEDVIHSGYTDTESDAIDVEIMSDEPAPDALPITPDEPVSSASEPHSPPHHFGLMSLAEANEAAAAMTRHAARIRNSQRR
jgi:hypothetical protein